MVVAQVLDYGSYVHALEYSDLDQIVEAYKKKNLATVYEEVFGGSIPETVNTSHNLVIVASALDDSSERIIDYLAEVHGLSINAVFFSCFKDSEGEFLGRAWLRDPTETIERAESKKKAPWSGFWFANVGEGDHRNWEDNRKYGYLGAGQGEKYSRPLRRLQIGDKIFAYIKQAGYVGFGEVTKTAVQAKDFIVQQLGKSLLDVPLLAPHADKNKNLPEKSEWAVGVKWLKTFDREHAKTFKGAFANQNIVCKLRDAKTIDFLRREFSVQD